MMEQFRTQNFPGGDAPKKIVFQDLSFHLLIFFLVLSFFDDLLHHQSKKPSKKILSFQIQSNLIAEKSFKKVSELFAEKKS